MIIIFDAVLVDIVRVKHALNRHTIVTLLLSYYPFIRSVHADTYIYIMYYVSCIMFYSFMTHKLRSVKIKLKILQTDINDQFIELLVTCYVIFCRSVSDLFYDL